MIDSFLAACGQARAEKETYWAFSSGSTGQRKPLQFSLEAALFASATASQGLAFHLLTLGLAALLSEGLARPILQRR